MGRSLTTLALLLAIVLAAALIVPAVIDWEDQRAALEVRLAEVTGGPVELAGPVSVRLLPSPRMTAARVSLGDLEGRLRVEGASLHAELALWPLFANQVVVTRIALEGGDVRFGGDAPGLRALTGEIAGRMSIGADAFHYLVVPGRLILGEGEHALVLDEAGLEAQWDGGDTPVRLTLRTGTQTRADATFRPQTDGTWRVNVRATYGDELAVLSANGVLSSFTPGAAFTGDFALVTDHVRALLGLEGEGPALTLRGPVHAEGPEWTSQDAQLTLGTMQAAAEFRGTTEGRLALEGELRTALGDLDALGFEMTPVRDFLAAAILRGAPSPVPDWLDLRMVLNADGLVLNDRVGRDVYVELASREGTAHLEWLTGMLPGGTNVFFAARDVPTRTLLVQSDSLRSLMSWLVFDTAAYPADRLQALDLELALSNEHEPLRLSVLDLQLDGGRAEGVLSFSDDGAGVASFTFDGLDLDAYVPAAGGSFISRLRYYAGRAGGRGVSEFNLSGERVQLAGTAVDRFRFTGAAADGVLGIQEAEMAFANGGGLTANGHWAGEGAPFSLSVDGTATDPGLFEGLPVAPREPADLSLQLARDESSVLTIEGNVRTQGLSIDLAGNQYVSSGANFFRGRMIARGQAPGALAGALGLDVFAAIDGAELLDVQWQGPLDGGNLTAHLELAGLSALARGTAAGLFSAQPRAELQIEFTARSARDLIAQARGPAAEALVQSFVTGTGQLRRTAEGWTFATADTQVDGVPARGALNLRADGSITGELELARLHLLGAPPPQPADQEGRLAWSTVPFDLSWMDGARADLNISIGEVTIGALPFDEVAFHLTVEGGAIALDSARGSVSEGLLTGSAAISRDEEALIVAADLAGEGVPADAFFAAVGLPESSGPMTLAAQLRTRGRSPFDLIAGLDGRIDLGLTDGALSTVDLGHLADALPEVRTRRGLREAADRALAQGATELRRLEGVVPVGRGVLSLEGLSGIAETGPFAVDGAIDLRTDIVDVETEFQITDEELGPAPVVVAFRGAGGALDTSIDISALQDHIGARLADMPEGLLSEDDLPEDLRDLLQAYEEAYPETDDPAAPPSLR